MEDKLKPTIRAVDIPIAKESENEKIEGVGAGIQNEEAQVLHKRIDKLRENMEDFKKELQTLFDMRTQIFAVLGMVFGVVAIIQIHIGMTKGFFVDLLSSINHFRTPWLVSLIFLCFLVVQALFMYLIYRMIRGCFHKK